MKIVVVSDTHMPRMNKKLPDRLLRELKTAKTIIHAGDWTNLSVYEALAAFTPVYGVAGKGHALNSVNLLENSLKERQPNWMAVLVSFLKKDHYSLLSFE